MFTTNVALLIAASTNFVPITTSSIIITAAPIGFPSAGVSVADYSVTEKRTKIEKGMLVMKYYLHYQHNIILPIISDIYSRILNNFI